MRRSERKTRSRKRRHGSLVRSSSESEERSSSRFKPRNEKENRRSRSKCRNDHKKRHSRTERSDSKTRSRERSIARSREHSMNQPRTRSTSRRTPTYRCPEQRTLQTRERISDSMYLKDKTTHACQPEEANTMAQFESPVRASTMIRDIDQQPILPTGDTKGLKMVRENNEERKGVTSLRDVRLLVEPTVIIRGGTAALICSRDMQEAPLYSVKWYRGNHEFYRYTPLEEPSTRVFTISGINVDIVRSNGSQVLLRKMDLGMAGNYSCEVTADAPSFATQIATKYIDVIALPPKDPVLKADKDRYQPGEVLHANCSSSPGRPAANLTIYVNEEPLHASETSLHPSDNGLLWTSVNADIKVTPELFPGGRLRVACLASVYEVYRRSAILDFFTPETDPRPERITLNGRGTKCAQSWILLFLLFLLPMVVMGQDYGSLGESFFFDDFGEEPSYNDYSDHLQRSLVGG